AARELFQAQGLLERVGIGFVERPAGAVLTHGRAGGIGPDVRFPGHDLLQTDGNFHGSSGIRPRAAGRPLYWAPSAILPHGVRLSGPPLCGSKLSSPPGVLPVDEPR